jgi:hypothetical protein
VDLSIGHQVITDDGERWQVHSITREGPLHSFVALNLQSSSVLVGGIARLMWFEAERAWRFSYPTTPTHP